MRNLNGPSICHADGEWPPRCGMHELLHGVRTHGSPHTGAGQCVQAREPFCADAPATVAGSFSRWHFARHTGMIAGRHPAIRAGTFPQLHRTNTMKRILTLLAVVFSVVSAQAEPLRVFIRAGK